ncbi:MAG: acetate--CoA ligase family protein [Anderseniella sp.]
MTPAQRANLERLLHPRQIAFVGGRDAAVAIGEAKRIGFDGPIWPVNPKRSEINGITCFASVEDLPEPPDAVFLAVPVQQAIDTVKRLADIGAGGIVCYTAGFGEVGATGQQAEQALIEAAGSMALVGPNCYGIINYLARSALWPFAHGGSTPGYGAAIITQSGMLSSDLTMSRRSLPLSHMISIGNQSVIAIEDLVEVLCEKPEVRAIGLHIEGLKDIGRFADAAIKAAQLGKPVVALKSGSSAIGKSLTTSHTGSLSGEDDLYDALFKRCGIVRVFSPAQLLETLKFMCIAGVPTSNRVAGFTCSGGGATMLADHGEKIGLAFPEHDDAVTRNLAHLLPSTATVSNPLDYTTPIWGQAEMTRPVFSAALTTEAATAVLVQDYPASGLDESRLIYLADADAFADAALAAGIPAAICSTLPENMDTATRDHLISRGIAPMQGINDCLDAIAAASVWKQMQQRIVCQPPAELLGGEVIRQIVAVDEVAAKSRLAEAGIPVPSGTVCCRADAAAAAEALGFPVAIKMVHEKLLHKTEAGAVMLNINTETEVTDAVAQIQKSVGERLPDAASDRWLIEKMQVRPLAELIVSVREDAQFGLAMTIGSGGVLVELVGDSVTVLLPCTRDDLSEAIEGLRISRLLDGFRGGAKADMRKLVDQLAGLADFMILNRGKVAETEINPMFVYEGSLCAVDALMHIRASE